ncbi:MAG: protease complex subunit PrcB family protein [Reyranella sp.]|nr:protease complex subunit PrcB family protein [Reyranella sp.]
MAQSVETRHWHGVSANTRQTEHVVAGTLGEWRSLWSRVGLPPPDMFEPGRMNAVGIFLGRRNGEGYSVNVISTSRRRDRIVIVFEERMPAEVMLAQRTTSRPVSGGTALAPGSSVAGATGFAPPGGPPPAATSLPPPSRPVGQPTSPWAIVLIHRADLPVSVEQRLFR